MNKDLERISADISSRIAMELLRAKREYRPDLHSPLTEHQYMAQQLLASGEVVASKDVEELVSWVRERELSIELLHRNPGNVNQINILRNAEKELGEQLDKVEKALAKFTTKEEG